MKPEEKTTTNVSDSQVQKEENNNVSNNEWKQVIIGGVSGIVMGVAGAMVATAATDFGKSDEPVIGGASSGNVPVAASVNDDMSFGEAFAAARAEIGAGGVFEWNGRLYNTFYVEEWNSMTPAQQSAFQASVAHTVSGDSSAVATDTATGGTDSTVDADAISVPMEDTDIVNETTSAPDVVETVAVEDADVAGEVRIIGVYEDTIDGQDVYVGAMEVDGSNVMLVDVDHDEIFDVAVSDLNNDGSIGSDEIADISGSDLTVNDLAAQAAMEQSDMLASNDMPDYMNDADVSMC